MPTTLAYSQERLDRFVGFAFAAADLLVEMRADQTISFAAGNFRDRFNADPEAFAGREAISLITPEDHGGVRIALNLLIARGRFQPLSVRLANPAREPMSLSGLRLPHRNGVSWLTLARLPAPPPEVSSLAGASLFQEAMAARLAAASPCAVGLLEVPGLAQMDPDRRRSLEADIACALREAGGSGALAGEIGDGKFTVLGEAELDMPELQHRVGGILRAAGGGRAVQGTNITMGHNDINAADSMRMMRFALASFRQNGTRAVQAAGFNEGLRGFLDKTEARAAAVRAALENGRFRLAYQPVVALADRKIHHFEALLRPFPIAAQGDASTQEFVTFAEAVGLAEKLDQAVLTRATETLAGTNARVAINVSGITIQSAAFRDKLLGLVEGNAALASRLLVELTETADIEDVPAAANTVNRLAAAGVPVCLDDFGAGFAAFRYLKDFKVAYVKIDGSFVRAARPGARESGFVGAMVELARCVDAAAIAEMVETEAQANEMASLGVKYAQGWLFGKPGALPGAL